MQYFVLRVQNCLPWLFSWRHGNNFRSPRFLVDIISYIWRGSCRTLWFGLLRRRREFGCWNTNFHNAGLFRWFGNVWRNYNILSLFYFNLAFGFCRAAESCVGGAKRFWRFTANAKKYYRVKGKSTNKLTHCLLQSVCTWELSAAFHPRCESRFVCSDLWWEMLASYLAVCSQKWS